MPSINNRKVLFFIAGVSPTSLERSLIDQIAGRVLVRSALHSANFGANLEVADAVAGVSGVVPADYAAAYDDVTPAGSGESAVVVNGAAADSLSDSGTQSSLTTSLTGTNNDLAFTAKTPGTEGDDITIQYSAQAVADAPLSVSVSDKAINVKLANTSGAFQKETATVAGTVTAAVAQVETATAAGTISGSGNVSVTVTAAGLTGSPLVVPVAVVDTDTAAIVAGKIRTALAANAAIAALFTVGGSTTAIVLTKKVAGANDGTLNIALATGTATGLTTAATSANTTAGVADGSGNATVVVTSADLTGSPLTISVPVRGGDSASVVATKIRAALQATQAIAGKPHNPVATALFTVGGSGATVTLTRTVKKANDATLNISVDNGTCTGLTTAASSADTTAGAAVAIKSTAAEVKAALEANADAAALITIANAAANDGSGIVTAMAATPLAGGADPTVDATGVAIVSGGVFKGVTV